MKQSLSMMAVASLILAGCTGPQPPEQELTLTSSRTNSEQVKGTQTSESYQLQQTEPIRQKGPNMKQLSDFTPIEAKEVTLQTTKGNISFELFRDKAPITTLNFLTLVKDGFYDGIVFHRVIPDFMAQVGDPTTKQPGTEAQWGSGGPGYTIPDEFDATLKHDSAGIVSMANAGPGTGGSQIFITYEPTPWLDGKHTVFGKVTAGMDVLEQIQVGDKIVSASYK